MKPQMDTDGEGEGNDEWQRVTRKEEAVCETGSVRRLARGNVGIRRLCLILLMLDMDGAPMLREVGMVRCRDRVALPNLRTIEKVAGSVLSEYFFR